MNRNPLVIINGYPQEMPSFDRVVGGGNISRGTSPPTGSAVDGDLFYNTASNEMQLYDGTAWISVGGGAGGAGATTVSATAPATPQNGSTWYDTNEHFLKVYLAATAQWVPCQLQFFIQDAQPTTGVNSGDIWFAPTTQVFSMYVGDTTNAWVTIADQSPLTVTDILAFG